MNQQNNMTTYEITLLFNPDYAYPMDYANRAIKAVNGNIIKIDDEGIKDGEIETEEFKYLIGERVA